MTVTSLSQFFLKTAARKNWRGTAKRCPENHPFPAALARAGELLGEEPDERLVGDPGAPWVLSGKYLEAMGASGTIAAMPQPGSDLDWAAVQLSFWSAGYECARLAPGGDLRERICERLRRGRAVMLFGKGHLPGVCLIHGYAEEGKILLGSEPAADEAVEEIKDGRVEFADWEDNTNGAAGFGRKISRPTPAILYPRVFEHFRQVMARGEAVYSGWIDVEEPAMGALEKSLGGIAEARWYGAHYLTEAASACAVVEKQLYGAVLCCEREHELVWKIESLLRKKASWGEIRLTLQMARNVYGAMAGYIEQVCGVLCDPSQVQ